MNTNVNFDSDSFWRSLQALPRLPFVVSPTALQHLQHLSKKLDTEIWCKRDDLIPFGLGGNKIRGLEFLIADALNDRADVFISGAGVQSNHVRASVIACCYSGLRSRMVFWGSPPEQMDGNFRITNMLGAEVVFTGDSERRSVDVEIMHQHQNLRQQGFRPYLVPRGGACALGVLGHVLAARELYLQCQSLGVAPKTIILATGSGGTQAGWVLGTRALGNPWVVESFTVSRKAVEVQDEIVRLANEASALLQQGRLISRQDVIVHAGFIGKGYGIPSAEAANAIRLMACTEGILLDPTYTGKAMAGMLDQVSHRADLNSPLVFIHSGGEPAYFAGDGSWLEIASQ